MTPPALASVRPASLASIGRVGAGAGAGQRCVIGGHACNQNCK
ncbi:hypothetical protein PNO31109_03625 [Pandoraea nosoerga]|uniref:Uncharacterized protein n=1 Tax=Pandoraea nosoerga TaxID=2508296 RepID=A0A5E4X3K7_9BURK|nr:hypothetical protein PNO31109_03625 [Pandoraea nosoerga]